MKCEILAPAGSREQLYAAIRAGADAVYLGIAGFNARQNAENFDAQGLKDAVSYAHARGVKVHVAFNTLIYDSQIEQALETAQAIAQSGADAVIIQDLGVAEIFKNRCKTIALHFSTQGAVHNSLGVKGAAEIGFSRVVLAREMSLCEIQTVHKKAPDIEIESFVHGALCVSASGNCYLSAFLGGRSGNRGDCAQPCRLDFKCAGHANALSLKDMSYIPDVDALVSAGVCSLKIEGRMKRPEYVAAAVSETKKALSSGEADMDLLRSVFSRSGFTNGYLTEKRNGEMFGVRTKEDVLASAGVLNEIHSLYRNENQSISVQMRLVLKKDAPSQLFVFDGMNRVNVSGSVPFEAKSMPTDTQTAQKHLSKTGGTPFLLQEVLIENEDGLMLPPSELKSLKRCALEALLKQREKTIPHDFLNLPIEKCKKHSAGTKKYFVFAQNISQIASIPDTAEKILPIEIINEKSAELGVKIAALPVLIYEGEIGRINNAVENAKKFGIDTLLCDNIGAVILAKRAGMKIMGGAGLNITNTAALRQYALLGVNSCVLSVELKAEKISALGEETPRGIIGYGYLPLMRFRACPARGEKGCGECKGDKTLIDRYGVSFRLQCVSKKYSLLLNSVPLYTGDREISGIDFEMLCFINETGTQCKDIYDTYTYRRHAEFKRTKGLYF